MARCCFYTKKLRLILCCFTRFHPCSLTFFCHYKHLALYVGGWRPHSLSCPVLIGRQFLHQTELEPGYMCRAFQHLSEVDVLMASVSLYGKVKEKLIVCTFEFSKLQSSRSSGRRWWYKVRSFVFKDHFDQKSKIDRNELSFMKIKIKSRM